MPGFDFADRYRAAGLTPSAEMIRTRQEPFEKLRKSLDTPRIIDLTRLYFEFSVPSGAAWFRDGFGDADQSFSLVNNARETAVLASCLLSAAMQDGRVEAGLAPLTASAGLNRIPAVRPELLTEARESLAGLAVSGRKHEKIDPKNIKHRKINVEATTNQVNDWPKTVEAFKLVANEATEGDKFLTTEFQAAISALNGELRNLREETDMLWWYVGGWSRIFDRPFSDYPPALLAVLAGMDLASLIRTSIGPVSSSAILHKLIFASTKQNSESVTVQEAVDAMPSDDLTKLKLPEALKTIPNICPVLTAFQKALEIGRSPSWHEAFRKAAGIEPTTKMGLLEIAVQAHREAILLNFVR